MMTQAKIQRTLQQTTPEEQEAWQQLILDRNNEVHQIEEDIALVLKMTKELNTIIKDQQPVMDRIDHKMTEAVTHTETGQQEIKEADEKQWRCAIM